MYTEKIIILPECIHYKLVQPNSGTRSNQYWIANHLKRSLSCCSNIVNKNRHLISGFVEMWFFNPADSPHSDRLIFDSLRSIVSLDLLAEMILYLDRVRPTGQNLILVMNCLFNPYYLPCKTRANCLYSNRNRSQWGCIRSNAE